MAKKDYSNLTKEQLLEVIDKLESKKKYGLVWDEERVPEKVVIDCQHKLPVLSEVKDMEILTDDKEPTHIIIEGDNYHALSVLSFTHMDKIDIIYIDPPYNTGNNKEWKYNDQFIDENDNYRHSKWLNMMSKRLELAKDLIKPGGSIFLSIGDEEVANLKLLCDKVFGLNNFITIMSRIAKTASNKGKYFAPSCDYILLYTKQAQDLSEDSFNQEVNVELYKKEDENGIYRDDIALYQSSLDPLRGCVNQRYFIQDPNGGLLIPPGESFPDEKEDAAFIAPVSKSDKVWRWSYATYLQKKELLVFKETKNSPLLDENGEQAKFNVYTKSYLIERQKTGVKPRNFLIEKEFLNRKGADYIKKMGIGFEYSKPKALIDYLFTLTNADENAIILDFFAGSGTTGEVILDLNNNDNGKRQFILCTNNEVGYKKEKEFIKSNSLSQSEFELWEKEGHPKYNEFTNLYGVATSVCYPRIKNVINGYKEKSKAAKYIKGKGNNLKYFKTSFVANNLNKDQVKIEITKQCTEMLCLKEGIFNLIKVETDYKIFQQGNRYLAVYYDFAKDSLDELKEAMNKLKGEKVLYCFTIDSLGLKKANFRGWKNIRLEPIPQKILDVYKRIFRK